jgi:thiol-disulfide isomerase/thioredoxin
MKRGIVAHLIWVLCCFSFLLLGLPQANAKPIGFAIPFPDLIFRQPLSSTDQAYLSIPPRTVFSFKEIQGNLVLVEFLSTYCVSCQRQAPIFNDLYQSIETDPKLKGKVKMMGIAAGNNPMEVEVFRKTYQVPYPILSDPKFSAHTAVGSPRTPFTLWVRKDAQTGGIVASSHLGLMELKSALDETKAVLQYNLALLKPKRGTIYEGDALKPPLTEEELVAKAREGMAASGGRVVQIEKIPLPDGDWVYAGKVDFPTGQKNFFSKLASRRAVCDICHDTFFIYTFDSEGKIVEIVPIQLTKIGNRHWTEEDIRKLRERTIGKSILNPFPFDAGVDSVSGATITAALIFDSLDKGKEIYGTLKTKGYIP